MNEIRKGMIQGIIIIMLTMLLFIVNKFLAVFPTQTGIREGKFVVQKQILSLPSKAHANIK